MPILKKRSEYTKFYRPNGSRYANGPTRESAAEAVDLACFEFLREFGEASRQDRTIIEVLGVTGGWAATVVEVLEPDDKK